jgi:Cytochrome bd terminal oxidase subunit II
MLLGLVLRGVAFETRWRSPPRRVWDAAFALGSTAAALAQGIVLGGPLQGVKIEGRVYSRGWSDWLSPILTVDRDQPGVRLRTARRGLADRQIGRSAAAARLSICRASRLRAARRHRCGECSDTLPRWQLLPALVRLARRTRRSADAAAGGAHRLPASRSIARRQEWMPFLWTLGYSA